LVSGLGYALYNAGEELGVDEDTMKFLLERFVAGATEGMYYEYKYGGYGGYGYYGYGDYYWYSYYQDAMYYIYYNLCGYDYWYYDYDYGYYYCTEYVDFDDVYAYFCYYYPEMCYGSYGGYGYGPDIDYFWGYFYEMEGNCYSYYNPFDSDTRYYDTVYDCM